MPTSSIAPFYSPLLRRGGLHSPFFTYLCIVNLPNEQQTWFEDWFDSPYYHLLYSNHDQQEAEAFIGRLVKYLHPKPGACLLDLACGKGRHSVALHKLGYDVTGIDLSPCSIAEAKKQEEEGLTFFEHDMRRPFMIHYFDGVLNFFTSFGYFSHMRDNRSVVEAVSKGLKPGGFFVIDFFNAEWVEKEMGKCAAGEKQVAGVAFSWNKKIVNRIIRKEITVSDNGKEKHYAELVQLLGEKDFDALLANDFTIEKKFGDYDLSDFDPAVSKRLILVARKR